MNARSRIVLPQVGMEICCQFSYVSSKEEVQKLLKGWLLGPVYLGSNEVSCYSFRFSVNECYVLKHIDELREVQNCLQMVPAGKRIQDALDN